MKLLKYLIFFTCLTGSLLANQSFNVIQQLGNVYTYQGDNSGYYKGDLVVVLSDNSAWKIHPDSRDKFLTWAAGEWVHVDVRLSFYWFSRQHKFELYNRHRRESVKVMLVNHKDYPNLSIVNSCMEASQTTLVPHYERDFNGVTYIAYYEEVPTAYEKVLLLNDGTKWRIKDSFESFKTGMKVYVGVNDDSSNYKYFLISGAGDSAVWTWSMPTS